MHGLLLPDTDAFLRYHDFPGREPAYVYLAGLGSAASAVFPRLARTTPLAAYRTILPDWLGCGFSDRSSSSPYTVAAHAETIATLLDALQLRGCVIVGHSFGGSVAITLASQRPDLASRLVLAEANLDAGGGVVSRSVAAYSHDAFVAEGCRTMLRQFHTMSRTTPGVTALTGMWQIADPAAIYLGAVDLVRGTQPSWREALYQLTMPRMYLFGEHSLPDPDVDELPQHDIVVRVVQHAGHAMIQDNPDDVAALLAR